MFDEKWLEDWIADSGTGHTEHKSINGIDYIFAEMKDGWIAIFEWEVDGTYTPRIQAADMEHALNWCNMRECIPVPVSRF